MLPVERQKKIIDLLMMKKVMKMPELREEMGISIDTLRRDINILAEEGKIKKIYGGVKLVELKFGEASMEERMTSHLDEKAAIAKKCNASIEDGDCIYLDSGSTTYQIAKYIKEKRNLTVITNSVPVIIELMNSDIELIVIGGKVRKNERSVVTYDYLFNFNQLNIQKAFICASGITMEKGISDYNVEEALARKKIIGLSQEVYIAADSSKFGKNVTVNIAGLDEIDYIVTDKKVTKGVIQQFDEIETELLVSEG
ncbi:DeoR/GlpR family DNA-binding transcription regulator [Oceanobacillus jeddahense]|uniref:DeoR/GlpR family DNA-binding transcription regulator n=1 Tax=Oceanobacillus jeddahense TaxID=1462527 RepID=A0ABY5JRR7_9BACI|nr:DeoR/GlpR family DNA-binding transcription regulator [Oceanobacillus jeddahense]UUI03020.1 DeoR/GlpR family DNA-binding transcription regulator [Oceanobacillus jeddahense]